MSCPKLVNHRGRAMQVFLRITEYLPRGFSFQHFRKMDFVFKFWFNSKSVISWEIEFYKFLFYSRKNIVVAQIIFLFCMVWQRIMLSSHKSSWLKNGDYCSHFSSISLLVYLHFGLLKFPPLEIQSQSANRAGLVFVRTKRLFLWCISEQFHTIEHLEIKIS